MKLRRIALLALPALLLLVAPVARAEDGEGGSGDLRERIKKKMEGILELMRENEKALLKLSTGKDAATKPVDVEVPDQPPGGSSGGEGTSGSSGGEGTSGSAGGEGASGGAEGEDVRKKLDELISGQQQKGGRIPDELKQVVEMIPL